MPTELYALSVLQPWAWLLFHGKPVENRKWKLPARFVGKTVAIHASARWSLKEWSAARGLIAENWLGIQLPQASEVEYGDIIGTLRFAEDVTEHDSPFFFGPHGWLTADARLLPEPIPCKGALGFWRVPDEIAARITLPAPAQEGNL